MISPTEETKRDMLSALRNPDFMVTYPAIADVVVDFLDENHDMSFTTSAIVGAFIPSTPDTKAERMKLARLLFRVFHQAPGLNKGIVERATKDRPLSPRQTGGHQGVMGFTFKGKPNV